MAAFSAAVLFARENEKIENTRATSADILKTYHLHVNQKRRVRTEAVYMVSRAAISSSS
jgi:hypothetical protein